eukprot:TRINITY_DN18914_c0_g1_i1.p1 TRINITY_DN18914_c0_g1~~TRINITY_DN18914_c0_g1_i1.p1  ORF type:complete len:184 (+),score=6.86 TRINITY_DN18914_c0_g1_i1:119-670(+)
MQALDQQPFALVTNRLKAPWFLEGAAIIGHTIDPCLQGARSGMDRSGGGELENRYKAGTKTANDASVSVIANWTIPVDGPSLLNHARPVADRWNIKVTETNQHAACNRGRYPSVGSRDHESGACRPCAWAWKEGGCRNGRDCQFCHLCSPGLLKVRRRQKTLMLKIIDRRIGKEGKKNGVVCF